MTAFHVYEWLSNLVFEVEYIWPCVSTLSGHSFCLTQISFLKVQAYLGANSDIFGLDTSA